MALFYLRKKQLVAEHLFRVETQRANKSMQILNTSKNYVLVLLVKVVVIQYTCTSSTNGSGTWKLNTNERIAD